MIENKDLKELQDMAEMLKALAHPVRLCIREFDTSKRKKHLSTLVNYAASLSNFSF